MRLEREEPLVFLPFVPYAVSLSLSISYKRMRHTTVPAHRLRARSDLQSICAVLDQLSENFHIASIMSEMGKAIVTEMDRVSGVANQSMPGNGVETRLSALAGVIESMITDLVEKLEVALTSSYR